MLGVSFADPLTDVASRQCDDSVGVREVSVKVFKESDVPQDDFVPVFGYHSNDERKGIGFRFVRYVENDAAIPDGHFAAGGMNRSFFARHRRDAKLGGDRFGDVGFVCSGVEQSSHFGGTLWPVEANWNDGSIEYVDFRGRGSRSDSLRKVAESHRAIPTMRTSAGGAF